MKKSMLAVSLITSFGLLGTSGLKAQSVGENCYCQQCCCNPCCCIPKPKKCVDCECYTPSFYDLQCDWGMFLNVDYLYWYAKENRLPFGTVTQSIISEANNLPVVVPAKNVYMKDCWDSGFRLGLGFNACDGWDLHFNYTWMQNCNSQSENFPPFESFRADLPAVGNEAFTSPWTLPVGSTRSAFFYTSNRAKWSLNYNVFDIELGRKYWLSRCFNFRPYAAVRGAWTKVKFKVANIEEFDSGDLVRVGNLNRFKNEFNGGGIKLGFDPTWYFSSCFALYGQFGGSLLWGEFEGRKQSTFFAEFTDETDTFEYAVRNDFYGMQSVFDLGMGLRFEDTYCCDRYRFTFDLGWEHHLWINHVNRVLAEGETDVDVDFGTSAFSRLGELTTDLGLGGLVVRARFDF